MNSGAAFALAWRWIPRIPESLAERAFWLGADILWRRRGGGVPQLEKNLRRVVPDANDDEVRAISRRAMRSYASYYAEIFRLRRLSPEEVARRVQFGGNTDGMISDLADGSVVLALGHTGNWDMAGAAVTRKYATVLTVAEVLEPEEVFQEFLAFREGIGLEIIPLAKGTNVFAKLRRRSLDDTRLVCLLADRDLTRNGVEVTLGAQKARVAPGPAALSLTTRAPLYFVPIRHMRVPSPTRWRPRRTVSGIAVDFIGPLTVEPGKDAVQRLTQAWVDEMSGYLARYPDSWHMLQKVFLEDLDRERLRKAEAP